MTSVVNRDKDDINTRRFGHFTKIQELWAFYERSLIEFVRVLKSRGVLVFKCQDVVDDKNYFSHIHIYNYALQVGFIWLDLFILLAKNRVIAHKRQRHARKYHSYFWVF